MLRRTFATATTLAAMLTGSPATSQDLQPELDLQTVEVLKENYFEMCGEGRLSIPHASEEQVHFAFFPSEEKFARIAICDDRRGWSFGWPVANIDLALSILSSKETEPFWTAAEKKWGPDLTILRGDLLSAAAEAGEEAFAGMLDEDTVRARKSAATLMTIGYVEQAFAMLDKRMLELTSKRSIRRRSLDFDRVIIAVSRANLLAKTRGEQAAASYLEEVMEKHGGDNRHGLNLIVNRAAYLAESGQYQLALSLIEPAYREFEATEEDSRSYKISGSDREFSWILACAHNGLGNAMEAARYRAIVETADESPSDRYLAQTKPTSAIKLRFFGCIENSDAFFSTIQNDQIPTLSDVWLDFQQQRSVKKYGYNPDWSVPEALSEHYNERYRQLPARYGPALRYWQSAEGSGG